MEYVLRFLIGGAIVSLFSAFGDVLRPKSVAGAPSVALATLGLAYWKHGPGYVATESLSMMIGAIALGIYSFAAWFAVALGLERVLIG